MLTHLRQPPDLFAEIEKWQRSPAVIHDSYAPELKEFGDGGPA
jgi:hypothetical protein